MCGLGTQNIPIFTQYKYDISRFSGDGGGDGGGDDGGGSGGDGGVGADDI